MNQALLFPWFLFHIPPSNSGQAITQARTKYSGDSLAVFQKRTQFLPFVFSLSLVPFPKMMYRTPVCPSTKTANEKAKLIPRNFFSTTTHHEKTNIELT
jgi:hypothetical protein